MRYSELTETVGIDKQIEKIKRDCQPFLTAINNNVEKFPMYRGINQESGTLSKKVRLKNRRPADMDLTIHNALNKYFTKRFGEPFRNAMFVVGKSYLAENFGDLYLIFPKGDFTFIWSPEVRDLHVKSEDEFDKLLELAIPVWGHNIYDADPVKFQKLLNKYMTSLKYTNKRFTAALTSGHEIMIRVPSYYGIKVPETQLAVFLKKIGEKFK